MPDSDDDEMVPKIVMDVMMGVVQDQLEKAHKVMEDNLERLRYSHSLDWADKIMTYEIFIQVLDHPNGGPIKLKKLLREQIEMFKQFDREEEANKPGAMERSD